MKNRTKAVQILQTGSDGVNLLNGTKFTQYVN